MPPQSSSRRSSSSSGSQPVTPNANDDVRGYRVTGSAAHGRVARLFQSLLHEAEGANNNNDGQSSSSSRWIDESPYAPKNNNSSNNDNENDNIDQQQQQQQQQQQSSVNNISFLWENAPRYETKSIRDTVDVYSHLPNGINVLDDKWALARLFMTDNDDDDNNSSKEGEEAAAVLESHCFRGEEFDTFARRVGLLNDNDDEDSSSDKNDNTTQKQQYQFDDLIINNCGDDTTDKHSSLPPPSPNNLWVVKDAMSNGAGGIWIVDPNNVHEFIIGNSTNTTTTTNDDDDNTTTQQSDNNKSAATILLHPQHRYIAQAYAWPPTLYDHRKCHVRVYAVITSDGRAYVHKRAFLHVANEIFEYNSNTNDDGNDDDNDMGSEKKERFEPAVHITNCCANSHDTDKFADYFPSIAASVAKLAKKSAPYVQGGQANNGFEYLGLDFVLSSVSVVASDGKEEDGGDDHNEQRRKPVAYLLEVNAPPSQDTATGLPHAEELHDEVISDLLRLWVLPKLDIHLMSSRENGWKCVYSPPLPSTLDNTQSTADGGEEKLSNNLIVPSKAAILNRIRWAIFERKASKEYESSWCKLNEEQVRSRSSRNTKSHKQCESGVKEEEDLSWFDTDSFVSSIRSQFPYFSDSTTPTESLSEVNNIFLESGGGAQVPRVVVNAMATSLINRDRSVAGAKYLSDARKSIASLLAGERRSSNHEEEQGGDGQVDQAVITGANATSLIEILAQTYCDKGIITKDDEIVIASENHVANVTPWIKAATTVGAKVLWWTVSSNEGMEESSSSSILSDLVNERTKIVAVSHASNIIGCVRDTPSICKLVHQVTRGEGHVVVDGVAAAPHLLSRGRGRMDTEEPDWYVVSLHKLFGPHLGCLIGKRSTALKMGGDGKIPNEKLYKMFEKGTANYEACAGAVALNEYVQSLGMRYRDVIRESCPAVCSHQRMPPHAISTQASGDEVKERPCVLSISRTCIHLIESRLLNVIMSYLRNRPHVRIIEDIGEMKVSRDGEDRSLSSDMVDVQRIPIISFVHDMLPSSEIVEHCRDHGVICRSGKFLSTDMLWHEMNLGEHDGVVRFSFAHYNTTSDITRTINVLEILDNW
ncbi:hypothetical protein ACHAWC_004095 [Mediolabrus comicus]